MRLRAPGIIWIDFQIVVAEIILGLTIVKSGYMVTNSSNWDNLKFNRRNDI